MDQTLPIEHGRDGASTSFEALVDREIARYGSASGFGRRLGRLGFAPELERRFEADTREARIREIRLTCGCAIALYLTSAITDPVFVPDLGLIGLVGRIVTLPVGLIPVFLGPRLSAQARETLLCVGSIFPIAWLAALPVLSAAPEAPCGLITALIALFCANTSLPLRFLFACICSAVSCAIMIGLAFFIPRREIYLTLAIGTQVAIAVVVSAITSYRSEQKTRLNYILSLRETLRLSALSADRAALVVTSNTDALTGIANRGHFDRYGKAVFADAAKAGIEAAILMVDVDHFKRYNDRYGHMAGDDCLKRIAQVLDQALPGADDLAARYGGEEFVILLLGQNQTQAEGIARRLCGLIVALGLDHAARDDRVDVVTVSIGVAAFAIGEDASLKTAIASADRALYVAKRRRNTVKCLPHLAA